MEISTQQIEILVVFTAEICSSYWLEKVDLVVVEELAPLERVRTILETLIDQLVTF